MYDDEVEESILHMESTQSITTLIFKLEQNRERIEKLRKNVRERERISSLWKMKEIFCLLSWNFT